MILVHLANSTEIYSLEKQNPEKNLQHPKKPQNKKSKICFNFNLNSIQQHLKKMIKMWRERRK